LPPARVGHRALEDRRPDRAGEIAAARNQRERRAAPAIEPAADIDVERRVHAADAEKADEQPLPDIELPGRAAGRQRKPDADHHRAREPKDSARTTSTTVATIQDPRVSTEGTPIGWCIIRPCLFEMRANLRRSRSYREASSLGAALCKTKGERARERQRKHFH